MLNLPLVSLDPFSLPLEEEQMSLYVEEAWLKSCGSGCTSSLWRSCRRSSSDVFLLQVNFLRTVSCSFCSLM